jgi:hypothetical protein
MCTVSNNCFISIGLLKIARAVRPLHLRTVECDMNSASTHLHHQLSAGARGEGGCGSCVYLCCLPTCSCLDSECKESQCLDSAFAAACHKLTQKSRFRADKQGKYKLCSHLCNVCFSIFCVEKRWRKTAYLALDAYAN